MVIVGSQPAATISAVRISNKQISSPNNLWHPCFCKTLTDVRLIHPLTKKKKKKGGMQIIASSMEGGMGIMGTKVGMMTHFDDERNPIPVTVIGFYEGNIVTQIKTEEKHGYNSVQIAYKSVKPSKLTKPLLGHLSAAGVTAMRHLQEFRLRREIVDRFKLSQSLIFHEMFKVGDLVDISGITIGKGFQGVIKRHGFHRGPMSHGSKHHRGMGATGTGIGRIWKGKKMPGKMGAKKRKIRRLKVMKMDVGLRVMMVKGSVPGKHGNLLRITPAKIFGVNVGPLYESKL